MRFLLALVASLAFVSAKTHHHENVSSSVAPTEKELESMFTSYVKQYSKKYAHDEFFSRFNTFKSNMEKIRTHNAQNLSYKLGVNEFSDMTSEEFKTNKNGFKNTDYSHLRNKNAVKLPKVNAGGAVDWRNSQAVTPVKDQGQCGSCWAFSTTGSFEGAHVLAGQGLVSLSEQQLVDCSTAQGNQGCNGGLMDSAFQYIIANKGITSEAAYPYTATGPNPCKTGMTSYATISSFTDVIVGSEDDLLSAATKQPVSVAIEADQASFQQYASGVYTDTGCGTTLDHGVLVVGYGTDNGQDYWIVKNSWGATWGEQGYIRILRGKNLCGISNAASYPVV